MKTIIIDWGGVILRESKQKENVGNYYCDRNAIVDTIKYFNNKLSDEEAFDLYITTLRDENNQIISSLNSEEDKHKWFYRINKKGNLTTNYDEFIELFENNYKKIDIYEDVVNYIYSLKNKAKLCLFSDLIFVCCNSLEQSIDLNVFDNLFLSYEEKCTKRDVEAFINVMNKLNIPPKDILFVDNTESNAIVAKSIGWSVCIANGYQLDKIKNAVEEFLNMD